MQYIGEQTTNYNASGDVGALFGAVLSYALPAGGPWIIRELTGLLREVGGWSTAQVRLAAYDVNGDLVFQGSAGIIPVYAWPLTWQGHIGSINISPNPCIVPGGTALWLMYSQENDVDKRAVVYCASGADGRASTNPHPVNYAVDGYPSSLQVVSSTNMGPPCIRVGFELYVPPNAGMLMISD